MTDIERQPRKEEIDYVQNVTGEQEPKGFIPIGRKYETPEQTFTRELLKQEYLATKKGLPFARNTAMAEYKQYFEALKNKMKYGQEISEKDKKMPVINWDKYSDLKNFELVSEDERYDSYLTRINPGLHVTAKVKRYKFKGYEQIYSVMEDGPSSIRRAAQKK